MTQLEETRKKYQEALAESQRVGEELRLQEAEREQKLREANKLEREPYIKAFESLGLPRAAAEAAVQGREEIRF